MGDRRLASSPGSHLYKIRGLLDRRDFCTTRTPTQLTLIFIWIYILAGLMMLGIHRREALYHHLNKNNWPGN